MSTRRLAAHLVMRGHTAWLDGRWRAVSYSEKETHGRESWYVIYSGGWRRSYALDELITVQV